MIKQLVLLIFLVTLFFPAKVLLSQSYSAHTKSDSALIDQLAIYQGPAYYPPHTSNIHHPFFNKNRWQSGLINLKGHENNDTLIVKYNINNDALIVNYLNNNQTFFYTIPSHLVQSFTLDGKLFEHLNSSNYTNISNGYFQVAYRNYGIIMFVKHTKKPQSTISPIEYSYKKYYYILINKNLYRIKSKGDLYSVLPYGKNTIKEFFKEQKIYYKHNPEYAITELLKHFNKPNTYYKTPNTSILSSKNINIKPNYLNSDKIPLNYAFDSIETISELRFFYQKHWIDSIYVKNIEIGETNSQTVKQLLENIDIKYLIDGTNVILSQIQAINTATNYTTYNAIITEDAELADTTPIKKKKGLFNEITIGNSSQKASGDYAYVSGYIKDINNGEPIIGATIYIKSLKIGAVADINGYYVLKCPKGKYAFKYSSIGMRDHTSILNIMGDGDYSLELEEDIIQLAGATIIANKGNNINSLQMGIAKLDIKTIKQIPVLAGELDIVKAALLLPGVQTVGEGASGFNVRGGSTDQNLLLINDSPIFNSSHLFGFFSTFNADVIKDFELYKSGIPANFGGRISSVLDVTLKNGNAKKYAGSAGIGFVFGKLSLEGPIIKDKGSFIIGARTTYSNWILKQLGDIGLENSEADFYDINANFNFKINDKNTITLSGYYSKDRFRLSSDTVYNYHNTAASLKWRHNFTKRLVNTTTLVYSFYQYGINGNPNAIDEYDMNFDIDYREVKSDFSFFPNPKNSIRFGISAINYNLNPGKIYPKGEESLIVAKIMEPEQAIESAIYVSDDIEINESLLVSAGYRHSLFFKYGANTVNEYAPGIPRSEYSLIGSSSFGNNQIIETYQGPELRLSSRYKINTISSLKLSYSRMRQYLHMLSNTTSMSPTDTWKLSDTYIPPQIGDQVSLGFYRDLIALNLNTSIEIYGKKTQNQLEYKGGAELLLNDHVETELLSGLGTSYGIELMCRKEVGRFNGWVSYTYSRSFITVNGEFDEEKINSGNPFPSNYDKPHDATLVVNYKFSRRFSASSNVTYSTGRPITYPTASYSYSNMRILHYSNRNEYRIPDYFRWDLSLNLEGNLRIQKIGHSFWNLSVYNVTGRDNVYSIYFKSEGDKTNGYKLSVFSKPIITLSYNIQF